MMILRQRRLLRGTFVFFFGFGKENEKTLHYHPELLEVCDKRIPGYDSHEEELKDIVKAMDVSEMNFILCNDMKNGRIICFIK